MDLSPRPVAAALAAAALAGSKDQTLDIYWVDVEGGGGTLLVTPAGQAIEVDSGVRVIVTPVASIAW